MIIEEKQPITFFPHAADTMSIFSGAFSFAFVFFFFSCSGDHRDLHGSIHSFPTRRSSDLRRGTRRGILEPDRPGGVGPQAAAGDRKSTRLNSSHLEPPRMPSSA